jgi:hypothetical protein
MKRMSFSFLCVTFVCSAAVAGVANAAESVNAQTAHLYLLQAAFHRAASVHDWVNGDSQAVVDQRIVEMLNLWTDEGVLHLQVGGPSDGYYIGTNGVTDPADVENENLCPRLSGVAGTTRGTLCTFFRYVAGSFQAANRIVSLAPAYRTRFDIHGNTADVYFECHYFNVAPAPAASSPWPPRAGLPVWMPTGSQIVADGTAVKRGGEWRFSYLDAPLSIDASVPDDVLSSVR